jgi:hypothetical protein
MQIVSAGFRDDIEDAPARAPELDAEIARLYRNLLDGVGNRENLFLAGERDVIVFGPVQHVVVAARALAVDGEALPLLDDPLDVPPPQTRLPEASVAPGKVRASESGFKLVSGKSRTSRGWKLPPRRGLSLVKTSLDSSLTSILVSAAPTSSLGSSVVARFASTPIPVAT